MMFCGKCGKEIADNSAFCPYCGQKVSAPAAVSTGSAAPVNTAVNGGGAFGTMSGMPPVSPVQPKKRKKHVPLIIISCVLVLALIGGGIWFFIPKKDDFYCAKAVVEYNGSKVVSEYDKNGDLLKQTQYENGEEKTLIAYEYGDEGMITSLVYHEQKCELTYSDTADGYVGKSEGVEIKYDKDHRLLSLSIGEGSTQAYSKTMEYYAGGQKKTMSEIFGTGSTSQSKTVTEYNKQGEVIEVTTYANDVLMNKATYDNTPALGFGLGNFTGGEFTYKDCFITEFTMYDDKHEKVEAYSKYEKISNTKGKLSIYEKEDDSLVGSIDMERDGDTMRYTATTGGADKKQINLAFKFDKYGHMLEGKMTSDEMSYLLEYTWEKK